MSTFVAIDFETATARRDSACAVGLAACCGGRIVLTRTYLIRPPRPRFTFTGVHGLGWGDVEHAPDFAELWPVLHAWIGDAAFLAAHNAKFDRAVLHACCARYRLRAPCNSPGRSGESARRTCPKSVASCASRFATTTPGPTHWRAPAWCSRPKPTGGGGAGAGSAARIAPPPEPSLWSLLVQPRERPSLPLHPDPHDVPRLPD